MDEKTKLAEAVKIVNAAITKKRQAIEGAMNDEDNMVEIEGETRTGYITSSLVETKNIGEILLDHDYQIYDVLEEDCPQSMWCDLADEVGLESVFAIKFMEEI